MEHAKRRDALACILLFTDTTVLARRNLLIGVLEVAAERRPAVEATVAVLARADVGRDTCVYKMSRASKS